MSIHVEVELYCDGESTFGCAKSVPIFARTGARARKEAREVGWLVSAPGGKDYCPHHRQQSDAPGMTGAPAMKSNRLAGHELPYEGRAFSPQRNYWVAVGPARCSCGEESPELPSDNARRRWHREHKDKIRAEMTGAAT